jgi:hypothetical protein
MGSGHQASAGCFVSVKHDLQDKVRAASRMPTVCGIDNGMIHRLKGTDFLYVDHAYFKRGWEKGNFRLVRGAVHLTRIVPGPTDRLKQFGVIHPYRKGGDKLVVLNTARVFADQFKMDGITDRIIKELQRHTDRDIVVRLKGDRTPMWQALEGAHAVVSLCTVAGVEAAMLGYPVFSIPQCPTWPINAGELKDIESPTYHDRYEWANSLAWATWNKDEIKTIDFKGYQCA